ncbi:2-C-methyl-D-erythritol 4-phosphate cytidylyltransferase [Paenibacillus chitinolyticus]|uniref:2-C-methyl-D-erythritol 4-phosphate cytidylyltransferase n=1 Tax=Paenibacillus chitinolyticus TaxID=79263 RepID=UPI00295EBFCD|nr:2-C-methyl-D-erythritol 4-phosphate cytidylyltransferase [Paenibacillus chitinolyticus]
MQVNKVGVIVVAAGRGSRMRTVESKQYLELAGKPILVHTLELFEKMARIDSVVLVTGEADVPRCESYASRYGLHKVSRVIAGGAERQDSVRSGLEALGADTQWVLVHDGVRPLVTEEQVGACLDKAIDTGAAVLAVPVKDTIKVVSEDGKIMSTPDRKSLWAIQTPQAFRFSLLKEAHEEAVRDGFLGTDDAMLVERAGHTVHVVEGDYANIKITTPEDLPWAEWLLGNRRGE